MKPFIVFTLILMQAMAQTPTPTPKKDWDSEYKTLSTVDTKFASRVKNSDGTWVKPKPEIVAMVKVLKDDITQAGKDLGVDPRAIAGCILAENTMNVGVSDGVQDLLLKMGCTKDGSILGKKCTFGIGQLNPDVAYAAEVYAAKIEKRTPMTRTEVTDALVEPAKAVKLIAATLRKIQDTYKINGFDISKNPEILATVYNLGGEESRAKQAKENKRLPRANYFGFFVDKYMDKIESTVGKPAAEKTTITPIEKAASVAATLENSRTNAKTNTVPATKKKTPVPGTTKTAVAPVVPQKKFVNQQVLSASLPLMQSPPTCEKEVYGSDPNFRYDKYKNYAVGAIADKGSTWKLLAPAYDCESQKWSLVRTNTNQTGWVKTEDLEKYTTTELREEKKCNEKTDTKCKGEVEEKSKKYVSKDAPDANLSYLNPISSGEKANFKNKNNFCPAANPETTDSGGSNVAGNGGTAMNANNAGTTCPTCGKNGSSTGTNTSTMSSIAVSANGSSATANYVQGSCLAGFFQMNNGTCVSEATLKNNKGSSSNYVGYSGSRAVTRASLGEPKNKLEDLEKTYKKMEKKFAPMGSLNDPNNPYAAISTLFGAEPKQILSRFKNCIDQQKLISTNCEADLLSLNTSLDQLKLEKNPKISDLSLVSASLYEISRKSNPVLYGGQMNGGMVFGNSTVPTSWAASDEQILNLDQNEALKLLETCQTKFRVKKMNFSADLIQARAGEIKQLSADDWQANEAARYNGANLIRACGESLDLFFGDSLKSDKEKSLCSVKAPDLQMQNLRIITKSAMRKLYANDPIWMDNYFSYSIEPLLQQTNPGTVVSGMNMNNSLLSALPGFNHDGDYCPNRTAEFIENLLENHPCIKKIYVPDQWLLNRLNQNQSKIVYRPFEKDDVYAIDYSEESCK